MRLEGAGSLLGGRGSIRREGLSLRGADSVSSRGIGRPRLEDLSLFDSRSPPTRRPAIGDSSLLLTFR